MGPEHIDYAFNANEELNSILVRAIASWYDLSREPSRGQDLRAMFTLPWSQAIAKCLDRYPAISKSLLKGRLANPGAEYAMS